MKKGFTLAEILITLGIIGIVAAMTLPSLFNNKERKELEAGLKKNYSVIQQALLLMYNNTGITNNNINYPAGEFKQEFIKYFNVLKDCGRGTEISACVPNASDTDTGIRISNVYKTYNGKQMDPMLLDDGQFLLTDGALILLENSTGNNFGNPIFISVDVNGYIKGPNKWGYDLFTFNLDENGKLVPMGADGTLYTDESYFCSKTSNHQYNGIACTSKALNDQNYWKNLH